MKLEELIFTNLLYNEQYARQALPHLKPEYFQDNVDKKLFTLIDEFFAKYNVAPTKEAMLVDLGNSSGLSEDQMSIAEECIKNFNKQEGETQEWIIDQTEKFCQDKSLYNAILASIKIMEDDGSKLSKTAIPSLLSDALAVSFDNSIGHDYLEDAEDRYNYYHQKLDRIPFDLEMLNKATDGGLLRKTLTCFMAAPHGGKTLVMNHLAGSYMMAGLNVLYITLEMSEEEISKRIDANLLNIAMDKVDKTDKDPYMNAVEKIRSKCSGKLIVKEYAEGSISSANLRYLLNELKLKRGFIPDVIFIDYINLMASSRIKMGNSTSYEYVKAIAQELRGLMKEFNTIGITSTQVNRGGASSSDMEMSDVSECIHVDTPVTLTNGEIKRIADVKVGDQITANDEYKTVVRVHHTKPKECIKIKLKSGKSIIVSKDHVFPSEHSGVVKRKSYNTGLSIGHRLNSINPG